MINQKAREIAERAFDSTASYPEKRFQAARLGIIEGRRQAFEEAAKVADKEMRHWDNMAAAVGCGVQRQRIFQGKANVADAIASAIRALIGETK